MSKAAKQPEPRRVALRKFEACHALVEIRDDLLQRRKWATDRWEAKPLPDRLRADELMHQREMEEFDRWLSALEMAGNALTR